MKKLAQKKYDESRNPLLIYYATFSIYSISCLLSSISFLGGFDTTFSPNIDCLQTVALLLLVIKYLSQQVSVRGWNIWGIGFASWICSHEGWLVWLALFAVRSSDVDIIVLAAISLLMTIALLAVTVGRAYLGVIDNLVFIRRGVMRQARGFMPSNYLGMYLFHVCVVLSAHRFGTGLACDIAVVTIATCVNTEISDSRISTLILIALGALLVAFRLADSSRSRSILSLFCIIVTVGAIGCSYFFIVAYNFSNSLHALFSSILNGRLELAHSYYETQPLTLFGSDFSRYLPIYWGNGKPYASVVDNAFCHLLLRYGIVPTVLFLMGLFDLLAKLIRERRCGVLLFGTTLMMIYGVSETLGIRVGCDFFPAGMGSELLFGKSGAICRFAPMRYRRTLRAEMAR